MGRGDNRRSRKIVQRRSQAKKKARLKTLIATTKKKRSETKTTKTKPAATNA
jgi:hypothetical protein